LKLNFEYVWKGWWTVSTAPVYGLEIKGIPIIEDVQGFVGICVCDEDEQL
jgi:hypothetical protein